MIYLNSYSFYKTNALNTDVPSVAVEYMMLLTHFIKLSLTVDFILVNKCQHDPVADNGTLKKVRWKRKSSLWWKER